MKKALKVISFVCILACILMIITGIFALTMPKKSVWAGFAIFNLAKSGTFMGYVGNILGILYSALAFGTMGFYGLVKYKDKKTIKPAFAWGLSAVAFAVISLIIVICKGVFTFGDLIITALPVAYIVLLWKSID